MHKLMNEAVFSALHKGIYEASLILSTCKTRQERTLLLGFITRASDHMAKLKADEPEVGIGDIALNRLIDSQRIVRDLECNSKISTVIDLINVKDPHFFDFDFAVESASLEASDDDISDGSAYDDTLFMRKIIRAMCPRIINK